MFRIKFLRLERELTLAQVAARTHICYATICNIENGRVNPRSDELAALARVLGCPPERLLDHVSVSEVGDGAEGRDAQKVARS